MPSTAQRRLLCLALAILTTVIGLVWRMAPLGLPWFLFKYGGSVLWAAMVYWLVAAAMPRSTPARLALIAALIALAVEYSRLLHTPGFDAFRETLAGKLLLGRYFSLWNVVAYWLGIAATYAVDAMIVNRARRTTSGSSQEV